MSLICTAASCGVGHRGSSDPVLLWLWCRPAEFPVPIVGDTARMVSVGKWDTRTRGDLDKALPSAGGRRCSKGPCKEERTLPIDPNAGEGPVPFPWVGSGRTFFSVGSFGAHWCWEKRERGGGCRRAFQLKPEQNGGTEISFDRKDIMLLSTLSKSWKYFSLEKVIEWKQKIL